MSSEVQSYLDICIATQQLTVYADGINVRHYPVSTAKINYSLVYHPF